MEKWSGFFHPNRSLLPVVYVLDRVNLASLFRSFNRLLEKVSIVIFVYKSFIIPTRNVGLSLGQGSLPKPCELLASWSLYNVSMTTHRADCKQTKGSVSQTAVKTPNEKHIPNVLCRCPRNAPKI